MFKNLHFLTFSYSRCSDELSIILRLAIISNLVIARCQHVCIHMLILVFKCDFFFYFFFFFVVGAGFKLQDVLDT